MNPIANTESYTLTLPEPEFSNITKEELEQAANQLVVDSIDPTKKLTPLEIRKLRKQYVTVKLPRVSPCNHRLDLSRQPRNRNCQMCWFAWFQNHGEIVQQLDEMFQEHGANLIISLQGQKFYHRWRQFMATIAQWKAYQEASGGQQ
jgi:hypothetical protein